MASLQSASSSLQNITSDTSNTSIVANNTANPIASKNSNSSNTHTPTPAIRPTQPIPKKSALIKTDRPRPHACLICTRAFARLEHLRRHERSHTNEKPFQCAACGRCFARRDLVLRHQQKLHAGLINNTPPPSHVSQNTMNDNDGNSQVNLAESGNSSTRKGKIYNSNIIEHKNNTDKIKPLPGQDTLPPAIPKQKKRTYTSQKSKSKALTDSSSSSSKSANKKLKNSSTSPNNESNTNSTAEPASNIFFDRFKNASGNVSSSASSLSTTATLAATSHSNSPETNIVAAMSPAAAVPMVSGTAMTASDSFFRNPSARTNSKNNSSEVLTAHKNEENAVTTPPQQQQTSNNNNHIHHHRHASFSAASAISYTLPTEAKVIHDQESIPAAPHQVEFSTPQLAAEVPSFFPFSFDPLDEDFNEHNNDTKNYEPIAWNTAYSNHADNNNVQLFNNNSNAHNGSSSSTPQELFNNNNNNNSNNQLSMNNNIGDANSPSPYMSLVGNFNGTSLFGFNSNTSHSASSLFGNNSNTHHPPPGDGGFSMAGSNQHTNSGSSGYFSNNSAVNANGSNSINSGSLTPFGGTFSFQDYLHVGGVGGAAGFDEYDYGDTIQVPLPNASQPPHQPLSTSSAATLKKTDNKDSASSIPILQSQNSDANNIHLYNGKTRGEYSQQHQQPALDDWLSEFIKTPPSDMNIDINHVGFDHHQHNDNYYLQHQQPHVPAHQHQQHHGSFTHPTPALYSPNNNGSSTSNGDIMSLFTDRQLDLFQQESLQQNNESFSNSNTNNNNQQKVSSASATNNHGHLHHNQNLANMAAFNMTPSNSTNSSTSPTSTASSTSNNNNNHNKLGKLYSAFDLHNTSSNNSNTSSSFSPGIVIGNSIPNSARKITPTGILTTSLGGSGSRSNTVNIDFDLFNKDIRQHILSKNGLQESQFPSIGELNSYIYLYWKEFDTYFPFIHLASLESKMDNIPLLLAVAAIGALYSFHSSNSLLLFNVSKKYIHHFLEISKQQQKTTSNSAKFAKYDECNDEIPLWLIQCLTLNMFLGIFNNDESLNDSVARQLNSLIYLLKKCSLHLPLENFLSPPSIFEKIDSINDEKCKTGKNTTPTTLKNNFDYFILAQSRIRTVHTILLVSILFDSLIGVPIILKAQDIKCGSPCENESLWSATSYTHWFSILMENHIIIDSKFVLVQLSNGENFKDLVSALENHNYMDLISKKVGLRTLLSLLMYIQETIYEQRIATREEEMMNLAEENKFKNKHNNIKNENGEDKLTINDASFVKSTTTVTSQAEELRIAMKWRMYNRSVLESLIKYWELLFIKNNGVLIPNNSNLELINRSPILKLILPLLSFAKIRLCLSMTPILQRVWAKDWVGMNEQLQLIEHDSEALKESSRYALNIIELWIDLISVRNDAEKTSRKTPIFFLTCTFTAILFLSEYLYAIETLANEVSNEITSVVSNDSDTKSKLLQRKRNVLTAADTALFIRVSNILKKVSVTLAPDSNDPQTRTYAEFLKIQAKGALNFDSAAINDFQNNSTGDHDSFEKLFNFIRHSRLSSKCLYLGIRILADAPIWPAAVLFAEALQARAVSISHKNNNSNDNNNHNTSKDTPSSIE